MFQKISRMESGYGIPVGDSRSDHLSSTRVAGHEMRFDQFGYDAQIGLDKTLVQLYIDASFGLSQINMIIIVAGKMVFYSNIVKYDGKLISEGPIQSWRLF